MSRQNDHGGGEVAVSAVRRVAHAVTRGVGAAGSSGRDAVASAVEPEGLPVVPPEEESGPSRTRNRAAIGESLAQVRSGYICGSSWTIRHDLSEEEARSVGVYTRVGGRSTTKGKRGYRSRAIGGREGVLHQQNHRANEESSPASDTRPEA